MTPEERELLNARMELYELETLCERSPDQTLLASLRAARERVQELLRTMGKEKKDGGS